LIVGITSPLTLLPGETICVFEEPFVPFPDFVKVKSIQGLPAGVGYSCDGSSVYFTASADPTFGTFNLTLTLSITLDEPRPPHFKGKWPPPPEAETDAVTLVVAPACIDFSLFVTPDAVEFTQAGDTAQLSLLLACTGTHDARCCITLDTVIDESLQGAVAIDPNQPFPARVNLAGGGRQSLTVGLVAQPGIEQGGSITFIASAYVEVPGKAGGVKTMQSVVAVNYAGPN
jgi:hypothetical protein